VAAACVAIVWLVGAYSDWDRRVASSTTRKWDSASLASAS